MYTQFCETLGHVAREWQPDTIEAETDDYAKYGFELPHAFESMASIALQKVGEYADNTGLREFTLRDGIKHGSKIIARYIGHAARSGHLAGMDERKVVSHLQTRRAYYLLAQVAGLPQPANAVVESGLLILDKQTFEQSSDATVTQIYAWQEGALTIPPLHDYLTLGWQVYQEEGVERPQAYGCPMARQGSLRSIYRSFVSIASVDRSAIPATFHAQS